MAWRQTINKFIVKKSFCEVQSVVPWPLRHHLRSAPVPIAVNQCIPDPQPAVWFKRVYGWSVVTSIYLYWIGVTHTERCLVLPIPEGIRKSESSPTGYDRRAASILRLAWNKRRLCQSDQEEWVWYDKDQK